MPLPICQQLKQELDEIKRLQKEFGLELGRMDKTRNLQDMKELQIKIEEDLKQLQKQVYLFETISRREFRAEYESQRKIFEDTGILKQLSSRQMGIVGVDGKEYPMPSYREITVRIEKNKEVLKNKVKQGFSRLLLVPFGIKFSDLVSKYESSLLKHRNKGELFITKKNPSDRDIKLERFRYNNDDPLIMDQIYDKADEDGDLVYYPKNFDQENHLGKTKKELEIGWDVFLIKNPSISCDEVRIMTPKEYLEVQKDKTNEHEIGMRPEDLIAYALVYLEKNNQVIDFPDTKLYLVSTCFPNAENNNKVPYILWSCLDKRVGTYDITTCGPFDHHDVAIRTMVKI